MALEAWRWLAPMRHEYLETFIPEGGGAVRFVVAEPGVLAEVREALGETARGAGLWTVEVDSASCKLHMLQSVFFEIAQSLDWDGLVRTRLERLVADAGYRWPGPGALSLGWLAEANGVAPQLLRTTLQQEITRQVWDDHRLAQDFRKAMIALLSASLADDPALMRDAVVDWLRGRGAGLRMVREAQIGARIGRSNARAMLISLCHWLRQCGWRGLFVTLDISQLLLERREISEGIAYTPAAVMDSYEVLRQIIDEAENFEGLFLVVTSGARLINEDVPRRALSQYTALKMRVWDDVRPQGRDNPLSPLVVLAS